MALDATNFHTLAMGGPSIHHYNSPDDVAVIAAADYFNDITQRLRQWDPIHIVSLTGGTPEYHTYVVTSANDAASVTTLRLDVA
jgi:hypothetical protein